MEHTEEFKTGEISPEWFLEMLKRQFRHIPMKDWRPLTYELTHGCLLVNCVGAPTAYNCRALVKQMELAPKEKVIFVLYGIPQEVKRNYESNPPTGKAYPSYKKLTLLAASGPEEPEIPGSVVTFYGYATHSFENKGNVTLRFYFNTNIVSSKEDFVVTEEGEFSIHGYYYIEECG